MNSDARFRRRLGLTAVTIGAGAFVVMVLVRAFVVSNIRSNWEALRPDVVASEQSLVGEMFDKKVGRLLLLAANVRGDLDLIRQSASGDPERRFRAFQRLDKYRSGTDVAIDVLDSAGTVLAWSGREVPGEGSRPVVGLRDSAVFLTRSKLHQYLSVSLHTESGALWIVARTPLELRYPISNKFVEEVSFAEEASREIGRPVEIVLETPQSDLSMRSAVRVPLSDGRGGALGFCLIAEPTLESVLERTNAGFTPLLALLAGLAVFSGLAVSFSALAGRSPAWIQALLVAVLIWGGRAVMIFVDFPKALVAKELFDASRYGAPFVLGLTISPGDTFLSALALLGTFGALYTAIRRSTKSSAGSPGSPVRRLGASLAVALSVLVCLAFTRAYGAAVRSFVFDSSIRYDEPSTLVPDPVALAMLGSLLAMTLALVLAYAAMLRLFEWGLGSVRPSWTRLILPWVIFFGCFGLLGLAYGAFLATPQVPVTLSVALAAVVFLVLRRLDARSRAGGVSARPLAGVALVLAFVAFAFAGPVLASKIQDKTEHELFWAAGEMVRPAGSWLPFVLSDGLQQIIEGSEGKTSNGYGARSPSAFELWARTLMSREGYNSAVILYGPEGAEIDRFSVGLTSYEQSELLQLIFELDEELPSSIERRRPGGVVRYYGLWGTLRNERGEVTGYVALMLSALQQSFFRGEASEKLGPLGNTGVPALQAKAVYAEYLDGVVESSNTPWLYPGRPLDGPVMARLDSLSGETFLRGESLGGEDMLMAYVADESTQGRAVAVGIETAGLRWQVFSAIRLLMVFLAFALAALAVDGLRRIDVYRPLFLGFRGKLLLAFLTFTVVPLLVLGYYNREFTIERIEAGIARDLAESLTLIERRVGDFVESDEDFANGVSDDFCDGIATEFGVDFSVFVGGELHASSRPELYQTEILSPRLIGTAYAAVALLGQSYYQDVEQIGRVAYAVGYAPFRIGERTLGILSVPTLYRQAELEEELAQRNAFVISVYGVILVVVLVIGVLTANALSRPVHDLTDASRLVARGNLDVSVVPSSRDEIGELVQSFNDMVKDLKKSRQELARAERESAWKEMAKQVAHEIKNPLTPMKLSLQHLRQAVADRAPNLNDIIERVTKTVTEQIDTLARIASEFSNFARMPERIFERCDVHRVLEESVELFRHIEGIEIRTKFSDTPIVLVADKDELRRVFVNILRNSVQAMERGGTIAVETEHRAHDGVIRFRDTGAGIPEELRSKVFQPNFSTKTEGMGLGLALSRRIVEDLNGRIDLESAVGRGTTITLTIPLALQE